MQYKPEYIELATQCQTIQQLAEKIGVTEQEIVTLARTFDDEQNLVYKEFFILLYRLAANEKECESCKPQAGKTITTHEDGTCTVCKRPVIFIETVKGTKNIIKLANAKQELFCQYYATDVEFFGNGVESYLQVYEIDRSKPNWYKTACAAASRLLSDVKVCQRISELLEVGGFNDENVDKQLLFVISQNTDFSSKVAAIREYNKLKKRITERIDHTTNGKELPAPIYGGRAAENI